MGGKKKKTETSQSTYGFMNPPETADVQAVRDFKPQADPGISYSFARAKNNLRSSFDNPLGAYTPAAVRDAMQFQGEQDLAQQEAQVLRESDRDNNEREFQKRLSVAGMTAPRLVQTGATGTATESQGAGGLISGIASVALPFL